MPLESLGKGKLNIRTIEMPETEAPFSFDLEKEFTPHVWEKIKRDLAGGHNFNRFLDCSPILELFPEKRREFVNKRWVYDIAAFISGEKDFPSKLKLFRTAKLMFPDIPLSRYEGTQDFFERMLSAGLSMQECELWSTLISYLGELLVIAPELIDHFDLEEIYRKFTLKLEGARNSRYKIAFAGQVAFVYPGKDVRSMLTESDIKSTYAEFSEFLAVENWHDAGLIARSFAFIEAEKIVLTSDGFKLTKRPKQDFRTQTPPLPELKK